MRRHLQELNLKAKPEALLEGTIQMVLASVVYLGMDGRNSGLFLASQKYYPRQAHHAHFAFTFDISGKAYARVLFATDLLGPNLADLYDFPFRKYKTCGFTQFWVTRIDQSPLTKREKARLEDKVTHDFRCVYPETELNFWFDDSLISGSLFAYFYEPDE